MSGKKNKIKEVKKNVFFFVGFSILKSFLLSKFILFPFNNQVMFIVLAGQNIYGGHCNIKKKKIIKKIY